MGYIDHRMQDYMIPALQFEALPVFELMLDIGCDDI